MVRKRYKKKTQVKYSFLCEGWREYYLIKYLNIKILHKINKIFEPCGGSADTIVGTALKFSHTYQNLITFFDEDFQTKGPILDETLKRLQGCWCIDDDLSKVDYRNLENKNIHGRNPHLLVSNPSSIEGLILRVLGKTEADLAGKTTCQLKGDFFSLIDEYVDDEDTEAECLDRIPTSDLKKFVVFLQKTDFVTKLRQARNFIPEVDQLLKAFGE